MAEKRIGFLGGTFDPVHSGHLLIAQDAIEAMRLDRVGLIPAARNPLKGNPPIASDEDRLNMLRAAVGDDSRFSILTLEIEEDEPSYTIDTVRRLRRTYPTERLFWIMGSDNLEGLQQWHDIKELVKNIEFIVLRRPGHDAPPIPDIEELRIHAFRGHGFDVSASRIRKRIKKGLSVDLFLPSAVNSYIDERKIYF